MDGDPWATTVEVMQGSEAGIFAAVQLTVGRVAQLDRSNWSQTWSHSYTFGTVRRCLGSCWRA